MPTPWLQILLRRLDPDRSVFQDIESVNYALQRKQFLWNRLHLALQVAILSLGSFILWHILGWVHYSEARRIPWIFMAMTAELSLGICWVLLHSPLGRQTPEWVLLGSSWSITLVQQIWATLNGFALANLQTWMLVFLTQATLVPVSWRYHLISQLVTLGYYFGVNGLLKLPPQESAELSPYHDLYIFWFLAICNLGVFLYDRLRCAEFNAHQALEVAYHQLAIEQQQSERLLLNILPAAVAERLKHNQVETIAESFAEVTVLFADIVGFTELASGLAATEVVTLLNQLFSQFDQLADQYQLEKIKTIGDAYMAVAGLPLPRSDHAEVVADMALAIQDVVQDFNQATGQSLSLRIGINTGPVVAGVIGTKKFIYDLWGDTVNIASRMESQGLAGCIQVTESTYLQLCDRYELKERGLIPIKGKGTMPTFLLLGRKP